jgi:hypothetical protein
VIARAFAALGVALLCAGPAAAEFDPVGTWYVLVHYRDLRSAQPDQVQWEDRLWVIEREGEGLRFREFPAVRFDDEGGRYERAGEVAARTLGAWEPSEAQRREIAAGLAADPYGAREKRLRRTEAGFSSAKSRFDSARVVGFESTVEIDLAGAQAPRFVVSDTLGSSAAAQGLEGRTEYRGEAVAPDGSVAGRFDRDGRGVGTFVLLRSGAARGDAAPVRTEREPSRELAYDRMYRTLGRELAISEALPERANPADAAGRAALLALVRGEVERLFADQGNDPRAHAPLLAKLAEAIARAYTEEGLRREEIGKGLESGALRP